MLSRYLSQKQLEESLSKAEFKNLEFILKNYGMSINSIYTERKILGRIHFAKNLSNFQKKSFRKKLYTDTSSKLSTKWNDYFKKCGVTKNMTKMKESEKNKIIKQYIEFDWGNNEQTKLFVKFFNYPNYMIPDGKKDLKTTMSIYGPGTEFEPLTTLLDYQLKVVSDTKKEIEFLNSWCLIQMPTGTGKTRVAMEIISSLLNENPDMQIIWFANKTELLEQAHASFVHVWRHVGRHPITAIAAWGRGLIPKIPKKGVIIFASYQKINNFSEMDELKPHYVIIDEAHQILAPTYKSALSRITRRNATRVIGMTATPGRGINEQQNKLLARTFSNNIIQINLQDDDLKNYEKNIIKYLEDNDILAKVNPSRLNTDFEYQLSRQELAALAKVIDGDRKEFDSALLQKLANDNTRNILIIEELRKLANDGKKILYFSTSKNQSILVYILLQYMGINAVHVDAETDPIFRRQIVRKFKDTNDIQVICNYEVFSTGFDVPNLDVVFIGRPVNSPVLFNQMVGRGTRGPRMHGKESFTLVQVIDKFKTKSSSFSPYEQYRFWDTNWE